MHTEGVSGCASLIGPIRSTLEPFEEQDGERSQQPTTDSIRHEVRLQARGTRLGARGKNCVFDRKSSPLASGPVPLAQTLAIAAEAFSNAG